MLNILYCLLFNITQYKVFLKTVTENRCLHGVSIPHHANSKIRIIIVKNLCIIHKKQTALLLFTCKKCNTKSLLFINIQIFELSFYNIKETRLDLYRFSSNDLCPIFYLIFCKIIKNIVK